MKRYYLFLVLILVSCTTVNTYCPPKEANIVYDSLLVIHEEWIDSEDLAFSTPRMSLAPVIGTLQSIKRDSNALDAPECLVDAQDYTVRAMEEAIQGFRLFLADEDESEINKAFEESNRLWMIAIGEFVSVNDCLPDCRDPVENIKQ